MSVDDQDIAIVSGRGRRSRAIEIALRRAEELRCFGPVLIGIAPPQPEQREQCEVAIRLAS